MFRRRRLLEEISERLAGGFGEVNERLAGGFGEMNERLAGGFGEVNGTLERMERGIDGQLKQTRASIENNTRVTRQIVEELSDQRPILEHIDDGVQANTEGLMHVLDELRGNAGPGTEPAA
jgi:hypothetical protein